MSKALLLILAIIGIGWLFLAPPPLPTNIGNGDFTGYWSAAYLLAHQQNFADSDLLLSTEQQLTGWTGDFTLKTWNPPWLLPLLLPYTLFSFSRAVWLWFITNITLVFTASILAWKASTEQPTISQRAWLAPLFCIVFAPALTAIYMGQINTLVFFGLALALFLQRTGRQTGAGAALTLTMVKPHLVYITVPILLLAALSKRWWRFIAGFGGTLVVLTAVTFALRPSFLTEYASSTADGDLLGWVTPTLGGFIGATTGWNDAKLMGLIVLPVTIVWWWRYRNQLSVVTLVQITLLISVVTAPFGWGYDVIVLLIPILQIIIWLFEQRYTWPVTALFVAALLLIDILAFYQRTIMQSEVEVFWIPLAITAVYLTSYYLKNDKDVLPAIAM